MDENGDFIHLTGSLGFSPMTYLQIGKRAPREERTILFDVKCSMGIQQAIEASGNSENGEDRAFFHEKGVVRKPV